MTLTLLGEPKSTNNIYRSVCRGKFPSVYLSNEGKAIKEAYTWEAKSQYKGKPMTCSLYLAVNLYFGRRGKHDIDNFNKLILDSLTGIVYEDDSQIEQLIVRKYYDKERPRVELEVIEML